MNPKIAFLILHNVQYRVSDKFADHLEIEGKSAFMNSSIDGWGELRVHEDSTFSPYWSKQYKTEPLSEMPKDLLDSLDWSLIYRICGVSSVS